MRACTHASLKEMMPNIWWDLPALSTLSGGQRPEAGGQSCQVQSLVFRLRPTFRMTTLVRNDWGEADTFLTNPNKKNDDGYSKMFFFVYSVFKYKTRRCAKVRVSRFHLCKIRILLAFNFERFPDRLLTTQDFPEIQNDWDIQSSLAINVITIVWTNLTIHKFKTLFQFLFDISGKTLCQDETMWLQSKRKKTISLSSKAKRGRS